MSKTKNLYTSATKTTLKGQVWFKPNYLSKEGNEDNYLIDTLPPLPLPDDIINNWGFPKVPSDDERSLSDNVRIEVVRNIKRFVLPLENFVRVALEVPILIREGYKARNPMNNDYLQRIDLLRREAKNHYTSFFKNISEINSNLRSTADSFTVLGISGMGKSTAVELALLTQPQIIIHATYNGEPCPVREQILWVKLECPSTRKALCREFFSAIDNILNYKGREEQPNYYAKFVVGGRSTDDLIDSLKVVVSNHAIGVLVIDEIQHLLNEGNDKDKILNFLVQLENKVGIPIILIGTPKANPIISKELMMGRRACGEGSIIWDRMMRNQEEWNFFIGILWKYQYTKRFIPLDDNLNDTMYKYSQGITAIAVNLFRLAQERAILSRSEWLNVSIIRDVAMKELSLVRPMVEAFELGDKVSIRKYSDMDLSSLGEIKCEELPEAGYNSIIQTLVTEKQSIIKTLAFSLKSSGSIKHLSDKNMEDICNKAVSKLENGWDEEHNRLCATLTKAILDKENQIANQKSEKKLAESQSITEEGDLRKYFRETENTKSLSVYDILKGAKLIKEPIELFQEC